MKINKMFAIVSDLASGKKLFRSGLLIALALLAAAPAAAQYTVPYGPQTFESITGAVGNAMHTQGAYIPSITSAGFKVYTNGPCSSASGSCAFIHVFNGSANGFKIGSKSLAMPAWSGTNTVGSNSTTAGTTMTLLLPTISELDVNQLMVKFWLGTNTNSLGTLYVGYVTADDPSTFVSVRPIPASSETRCTQMGAVSNPGATDRGTYVEVSLNAAPASATRIALQWVNTTTSISYCCIDNLEIKEIPPCPSVTALTADAQFTTATLSWTELGTATEWQIFRAGEAPVTVTSPTHTLTGLTPGTDYTVTVAAKCGTDVSDPVSVSFRTLGCDPVTGLTAEALYTTATIRWTAAGTATEWQVSLDGGTPVTVTSPTYTFTGLAPNTDFTATVRASCAVGVLSTPVSVNFRTVCTTPTNFKATDVTGGRLVVEWSGDASQYEVQIATNAAFTADFQTQTVSTTSATFPGLEIGERFYVRVRALCSASDVSAWTPSINVLISDIPETGLYPDLGMVVLNDLESHSWAYYSDTNSPAPLHSYNPADVKIVYFGNGTSNVENIESAGEMSASPSLDGFTAPSISAHSEGAAVGISEFDRRFDKFHYYKTLERVDGKTAATPEAATGRCPYRTIFNPFSLRPIYWDEEELGDFPTPDGTRGENLYDAWRGFYVWRLKHVAGGAVYRTETGGTALAVGDTVGADVQLYFQPVAADGMEVEFEALWARAQVFIAYDGFQLDNSNGVYVDFQDAETGDMVPVSEERSFIVLQDFNDYLLQGRGQQGHFIVGEEAGAPPRFPVTYTSVLPNGTSDGITKVYEAMPNAGIRIDQAYYQKEDLPVRCHADTRFEYITLYTNRSGEIHGSNYVPNSSFSADGHNFTMGRGMKHVGSGSGWADGDHGINYLWGIGRITHPDYESQAGTHQFYTDRFEEIITASSYSQNLSAASPDPDNLPGYSTADSAAILAKAAHYKEKGRSLNYTLRLETGRIGYPLAYYGWNQFVSASSYGNYSGKRGLYCAPHVWVTGENNHARLILGNDYDRAREDSKQWAPEVAKDSCSLRTSVPFRGGNYWIQMPNQDQSKLMFTAVIKSGFHGYRMWRRAYDPAAGSFYAGGHVTPGYNYDTSGYSGSEGTRGSGQIDYLSSSNGSLPYGFGDGGTDGDPKNIYVGVSNNPTMFKGKRYCLVEGGYLWTSLSGCAWDTAMTNREDVDVAVIRMKGGQIYGSIFGGTNTYADGAGGRQIICTGGKVWGWLSGGANGTAIADQEELAGHHWGSTYIYAGGTFQLGNDTTDRRVGTWINTIGRTGANDGNLFGAGCGIKPYSKYASADFNNHAWKFHECGEVWNSTVVVADQANVLYDVYGGGNYGYNKVGYGSDVRILGGRVGGKVFGGSNNKSTGSSRILMTGGQVEQGIYGGCNNWGLLIGDVDINIVGGTVGSETWPDASVFGGGFGENTSTSGNITVNIGDSTTWTGPKIWGDVYGGSQMGNVLGGDTTSSGYTLYRYRINNETNSGSTQYSTTPFAVVGIDTAGSYNSAHKGTVSYFAGNVGGNIYGGGYGQDGKRAKSYGDVTVRIMGDFDNSDDPAATNDVYGANNLNGEPVGQVQVIIGSTDSLASGKDRNRPVVRGDIYGGGNMAAYGSLSTTTTLKVDMFSGSVKKNVFGGGRGLPATVNLPSGKAGLDNDKATDVHIHHGFVNGNVYGGGNAAKVVGNTHVEIGD